MSMTIQSSVTNKILAAQGEAFKVGFATAKMLRGMDQQIEKKEDGGLYFIDQGWDFIDRKCRSPVLWPEVEENRLIGPEMKGVIRFGKNGKLTPRYVGPFEILERIGPVAYRLRFPEELSSVHDTFHVSNLKKCLADANLHVPLDEIKIDKTLRFVEEPVEIMDHEVKSLKHSKISIVKVHWNSKRGPEFTWEREDHMKANQHSWFKSLTYCSHVTLFGYSLVKVAVNLCRGYNLLDHILGTNNTSTDDTSSSEPTPPTAEWLTIDSIILTWIFTTLSKTLQQRLVVENPTAAKEAWDILALIFNDNKRSRSIALKAELGSIKLGYLSIDYQHVSDIIIHRDPYPDLKMVRYMLTTAEMRLKSRTNSTYFESTSSSPMVLLANSGVNAWRSTNSNEKVNKPCFNFNKGSCRFGDRCKFLHNGVHGNPSLRSSSVPRSTVASSSNLSYTDMQTLQSILAKLKINGSMVKRQNNNNSGVPNSTSPMALYASPHGSGPMYSTFNSPPGFNPLPQAQYVQYTPAQSATYSYYPAQIFTQPNISTPGAGQQVYQLGQTGSGQPDQTEPVQPGQTGPVQFGLFFQPGQTAPLGQLCGVSSYINDSVSSLSDVFNSCIYPSVSVGDSYSIPVTNSGHSILPTPYRPLHLHNVLITPNIVKNFIFIRQFVRDNFCTVEFNAFGFSVKDFLTRRVLLRCDSTRDLYPVMKSSTIPHAFLTKKPPVLCHACQLGKHVQLSFVSSTTSVQSCFDIVHSDLWTSSIPSLSGFKHYVLFLDHYSQYV
nr:putative reverse transcriptase domain-containing protein [Tanacetum cinerariifolium]